MPAGLIGGRLYFLATSWNEVPTTGGGRWRSGRAAWGSGAASSAACWAAWSCCAAARSTSHCSWTARRPGLLVAQAIGRIGNWFNQELFGGPTTLPWGLEIDPQHRPAGYAQYATFHPTFLYELIWNLALAAFLVDAGPQARHPAAGDLRALRRGLLGFARIGEELLRTDPSKHILGLRLKPSWRSCCAVGGLVWFWVTPSAPVAARRSDQSPGRDRRARTRRAR